MKSTSIILAALAVFAGFFLLNRPPMMSSMQPLRTISVSGQATKKIVPDEAHLRVNLNSMKPKMVDAKASHDEKLKALLEITKSEGVEERKVRTESSSIQPIYEYVNNGNNGQTRVFRGYRIQTQLDITVVDTAKVGALMEKITNAGFEQGANTEWGNLLDLQYQVSEPEKKRDELLAEAIEIARAKAERMAKAGGSSVARVQQITEGNVSNFNPPMPVMAMGRMMPQAVMAEEAAVAPPSGEQQLNANVSVVFELN